MSTFLQRLGELLSFLFAPLRRHGLDVAKAFESDASAADGKGHSEMVEASGLVIPPTKTAKGKSKSRDGALPPDFLWGFATASYQVEGAATEDGRGPSIWDTFCKIPGKIADGSSGDVACDSYHRTEEDIALLQGCGAKAYRFSLSWSRIIPLGGRHDPVNQKGLTHYVRFVDALLAAGITPMVTLFHWDLPDNLEKRYGGLRNKAEFVADFENYARVVFEAMGGRVRHWITFNEPYCSAVLGYNVGAFAPGRSSDRARSREGDSGRECWVVGHNILVAHAVVVNLYRKNFKRRDEGEIGITLNGDWVEPWDVNCPEDIEACERKLEFSISWFADPVYFGKYPDSMRAQLGDRLPTFTPEESALVKGSNDFYGMNHYTANFIRHKNTPPEINDTLGNLEALQVNNLGVEIGPETQSAWLRPCPLGFRKLLSWISTRYNHPKIYVTENGTSIKDENELPFPKILDDEFRAEYFRTYISALVDAVIEDGVDVRAYMAWSLMDNFEWAEGYETRFGVTFVDYEGGQRRVPKKSAGVVGRLFERYIEKH